VCSGSDDVEIVVDYHPELDAEKRCAPGPAYAAFNYAYLESVVLRAAILAIRISNGENGRC
jgi:hypothetical protein